MKLRIRGNSIRFRLGQSEVCRLATEGMIEAFTDFGAVSLSNRGTQRFGYELHASFERTNVSAAFSDGKVIVRIPAETIHHWARTDQVGIEARQHIGDGNELRILIEKDFACIDGTGDESQEDAFPTILWSSLRQYITTAAPFCTPR